METFYAFSFPLLSVCSFGFSWISAAEALVIFPFSAGLVGSRYNYSYIDISICIVALALYYVYRDAIFVVW